MNNASNSDGGIAGFAIRHSRAVILLVLGLCVAGILALFALPSGIYPAVAFPRIVVIAERGEDSVENMMIGVTRPLEDALNAVPELKRVRSKTIRGASELSLDFVPSADMKDALSQTRARAMAAISDKTGISLTVEQQTPSVFPVISFNLALDKTKAKGPVSSSAALNDWALLQLKPRFTRLKDVFLVSVQGAESRQITVEADPVRLSQSGVTLQELGDALKNANTVGAVGYAERDYRQFQILVTGELHDTRDIENVPVANRNGMVIQVKNVANVVNDVSDRTSIVTGSAGDSVVVSIFMRYGGKITELSDSVNQAIAELKPTLPAGVSIQPVYDQAILVRESLGGVRDAMVIGMILAVCVLFVFLRSGSLTLIAGLTIPISILGTFAAMWAMGESLNLMSLGGIAVAVGLIIDDAIVVVENIARCLPKAKSSIDAAITGTREIFGAVVGSSLTTVVVFAPLILLEGIVGQFFRALALALAIGILVSTVISLTLTPLLCSSKIGPQRNSAEPPRWMAALSNRCGQLVELVLGRRVIATLALVIAAGLGSMVALHQETGFLPDMDEGGFVLDYTMPVGTSLSETDKNCRKIERILNATPEVAAFSRRTGAELGFFATEQFSGDFLVALNPKGGRKKTSAEVTDEIREQINTHIPQIEVSFVQIMQDTINDLAGNPAPVEVKVFGSEYPRIQAFAGRAASAMAQVHGIVDISEGVSFGSPEITWTVSSAAAARAGLDAASIDAQLRTALLGENVTNVRNGERIVPVVVRYPNAWRRNLEWLPSLPIATSIGTTVPMSSVASVEEKLNATELA
ncbi:MAG: efflux RND transporter permease subunit, partial [Candidatus Sumerlaeota bacterium]